MILNVYKVPKRQWKKWTLVGKFTFNELYADMKSNKSIFNHPKTDISDDQWDTICWNAAWHSATILSNRELA